MGWFKPRYHLVIITYTPFKVTWPGYRGDRTLLSYTLLQILGMVVGNLQVFYLGSYQWWVSSGVYPTVSHLLVHWCKFKPVTHGESLLYKDTAFPTALGAIRIKKNLYILSYIRFLMYSSWETLTGDQNRYLIYIITGDICVNVAVYIWDDDSEVVM